MTFGILVQIYVQEEPLRIRPKSANSGSSEAMEFVPLLATDDPRYKSRLKWALILLLAPPTVILLYFIHQSIGSIFSSDTWQTIAEQLHDTLIEEPWDGDTWVNIVMFLIGIPLAAAIARINNRRVLRIDEYRIQMLGSPVDRIAGMDLNWTINLSEIVDAWGVKSGLGKRVQFLNLKASRLYRINLLQWVPRDYQWPERSGLKRMIWDLVPPWHKNFEQAPVVQQLVDVGVQVDPMPKEASFGREDFDLAANRYSLGMVITLFVLILYACADLAFGQEQYVGARPFNLFGMTALAFFGLGWLTASKGNLPQPTGFVLCALLGVGGFMAAYPGALRVNALLDSNGAVQAEYYRIDGAAFASMEGGWPDLEFPDPPYWSQLTGEVKRTITIRRGGLGFVQVNFSELYPEIRAHYKKS